MEKAKNKINKQHLTMALFGILFSILCVCVQPVYANMLSKTIDKDILRVKQLDDVHQIAAELVIIQEQIKLFKNKLISCPVDGLDYDDLYLNIQEAGIIANSCQNQEKDTKVYKANYKRLKEAINDIPTYAQDWANGMIWLNLLFFFGILGFLHSSTWLFIQLTNKNK